MHFVLEKLTTIGLHRLLSYCVRYLVHLYPPSENPDLFVMGFGDSALSRSVYLDPWLSTTMALAAHFTFAYSHMLIMIYLSTVGLADQSCFDLFMVCWNTLH